MPPNDPGLPAPSLVGAPWLARPATMAVIGAISAGGYDARIVGGAVRNALLGAPVKDIDIATTAVPGEVIRLAAAAGLRAVPTGIEHGTVTVVVEHTPIEVTTLRRDVETYGRHAKVAFTTDWAEDARRRDFTMNALYCALDGTVFDPLGGYGDLHARRVRFIGDAGARIREDFLRILRFFRFTAEYSEGAPDPAGLAAAIELKGGLDHLSGERLRAELLRLLDAPRAVATVAEMDAAGILAHVLGKPGNPVLLARLANIERALDRAPDPLLRLGALAATRPGDALNVRDRLRLSGAEFERLTRLGLADRAFDPVAPECEAKEFIYRHGAEAFTDGALLAWAKSADAPDDKPRRDRADLPHRWQAPELPIRGTDVIALGVPEGPAVGRVVHAFEDWWIKHEFPSDPALLAAELARVAKAVG